jgi:hypothetical protein
MHPKNFTIHKSTEDCMCARSRTSKQLEAWRQRTDAEPVVLSVESMLSSDVHVAGQSFCIYFVETFSAGTAQSGIDTVSGERLM